MSKLWHAIGQRHCNLPLSRLFGKWEHIELHLRRKRKRNDELNNVTQVIVYERIGLLKVKTWNTILVAECSP